MFINTRNDMSQRFLRYSRLFKYIFFKSTWKEVHFLVKLQDLE